MASKERIEKGNELLKEMKEGIEEKKNRNGNVKGRS